jgi:hypothetical protein
MLYKLSLTSREEGDIRVALDGPKYLSCLYDIAHAFREASKYNPTPETTWGAANELLWQVLREHDIDPYSE